MAFNYPEDCDSPRRKAEFLYKAQEELRILHNIFSKWLHEGLTSEEYDELPFKIKEKYPYNLSEYLITKRYKKPIIAIGASEECTNFEEKRGDFEMEDIKSSVKTLPQAEWDKFQKEEFTLRSNKICQEICVQRAEFKKSTQRPIDIGAI
jgi:hypothetical protein